MTSKAMRTLSLQERIEWLERDLPPSSWRFRVHDDLPFAILVYSPEEEWALRKEVKRLAARLAGKPEGPEVVEISLAGLLWTAIEDEETGGLEDVVQLERERGFEAAQAQVNTYLTDPVFHPLPDALAERMRALDPARHLVFLTRAASMGPDLYHLSTLLEAMMGKVKPPVPAILFYPGELVDTNALRFMSIPERDALGSYRVKVYA